MTNRFKYKSISHATCTLSINLSINPDLHHSQKIYQKTSLAIPKWFWFILIDWEDGPFSSQVSLVGKFKEFGSCYLCILEMLEMIYKCMFLAL